MKVRAKANGYDGVLLRTPGDVFEIADQPTRQALTAAERAIAKDGRIPAAFSERWMEAAGEGASLTTRAPRPARVDPAPSRTADKHVI